MVIMLKGTQLHNGMLIDYYEVENIVKKILEKYDHAFLVEEFDVKMKNFL